jgi:hypothetical protein
MVTRVGRWECAENHRRPRKSKILAIDAGGQSRSGTRVYGRSGRLQGARAIRPREPRAPEVRRTGEAAPPHRATALISSCVVSMIFIAVVSGHADNPTFRSIRTAKMLGRRTPPNATAGSGSAAGNPSDNPRANSRTNRRRRQLRTRGGRSR